mmetsp:Transcript_72978/g.188254  ORF Transcript_72978/g.188254 Transcript_72978/m.188254 type:complete len:200 (-) Transcript_72978:712-1311(-)
MSLPTFTLLTENSFSLTWTWLSPLPLASASAKTGTAFGPARYLPAIASQSWSPWRSKSVLPPEAMMDTQPPRSAKPRMAVPNTLTATRLISSSLLNRPMIGDEVSGIARTLTQSETHTYLPAGYSFASGADRTASPPDSPSYLERSMYCFLPGAGRTSSGTQPPSGIFVSWPTRIHLSPTMSAAYSLLKRVGFSTQAPA